MDGVVSAGFVSFDVVADDGDLLVEEWDVWEACGYRRER